MYILPAYRYIWDSLFITLHNCSRTECSFGRPFCLSLFTSFDFLNIILKFPLIKCERVEIVMPKLVVCGLSDVRYTK